MDASSHRIEPYRVRQIIRCKVRISHRLFDSRMAQYALQRNDIATVNHKVGRKCVPKNVKSLTLWKFRLNLSQHFTNMCVIDIK